MTRRDSISILGTTALGLTSASPAFSTEAPVCAPLQKGEPMLVTADCQDPLLHDPVIDKDEWRDTPVRHRYVNGHFGGTTVRFSFYFAEPDKYQKRFFQNTHQLLTSENAPPNTIAFAIASGGYYVQSIPGLNEAIRSVADSALGRDPAVVGYRVNAAAAKYSRIVASKMYGEHRPYGYIYGGSGGAYQVIAALQNTRGVWDGGVPYVMGAADAIPNVFTVRIHALQVLKKRFPQIMDAIEPGGSGDMYAGLNEEERGALEEATKFGFPPSGWFDYPTMTGGPLALVAAYVPMLDPTYVDDFWSKPGYLGTDPKSSIGAARIRHEASVVSMTSGPPPTGLAAMGGALSVRIELSSLPAGDLTGADMVILSGDAAGMTVPMSAVVGAMVPGAAPVRALPLSTTPSNTVAVGLGADPAVVARLKVGDKVRIDNSWYLALQTYHRHQVPTPDLYAWNQFRKPDGSPLYPQRKVRIGPIGAFNGAGSLPSGRFNGKMIVMQALGDIDAIPWQADWYRTKVQQAGLADSHRLYYVEHSDHIGVVSGARSTHLVNYEGALQQIIRDLTAWVERGVEPPPATSYRIVDSQVVVPLPAAERRGIQPVVALKANGGVRADIASGASVTFSAEVEVPPGMGKIVSAEWDFDGQGSYPQATEAGQLGKSKLQLQSRHTFTKPGTYFPALRVASQRNGDFNAPFARVQNVARVRVVVT
jgi:hypothetical protein